jgi:hypothetical protein
LKIHLLPLRALWHWAGGGGWVESHAGKKSIKEHIEIYRKNHTIPNVFGVITNPGFLVFFP